MTAEHQVCVESPSTGIFKQVSGRSMKGFTLLELMIRALATRFKYLLGLD
ncbi:hypothetical protein [Thermosphaera aggregans]|nr:hypothetical protein [Thermosphaera aggregans]